MSDYTLTEFRRLLQVVRNEASAARNAADRGDLLAAYERAERAQHAAFTAKSYIGRKVTGR